MGTCRGNVFRMAISISVVVSSASLNRYSQPRWRFTASSSSVTWASQTYCLPGVIVMSCVSCVMLGKVRFVVT